MGWIVHIAHGEKRNEHCGWKERENSENLNVGVRIILKRILRNTV
jgi:hypothetical protein